MKDAKIDAAVAEAQRFIDKVEAYQREDQSRYDEERELEEKTGREQYHSTPGALHAAVRRASLDLTRSLAEMRRS